MTHGRAKIPTHTIPCTALALLILLLTLCPIPPTRIARAREGMLIASFSTYYKESAENRKFNVELAARKIDGTVLYPEDEFSFNDTVGKRTESNGFKNALIIKDGEFVEGVGGGVCQVSTTLYNCALLAGLVVTSVRAHSLPVSYVAPSFDAMVSSDSDLRFVNVLSGAVTIKIFADGTHVRAEIYGHDKIDVRRRSEIIEKLPFETQYVNDETLPIGNEKIEAHGKNGLKSEGYLDFYEKGKPLRSVRIRRDTYLPQKRIVRRGTKDPSLASAT